MTSQQPVGRPGVVAPPNLPTIRETTLSWMGSDLESSMFSTNGKLTDNDPAAQQLSSANVQRYIDFDEQCLSVKSGEGSDFSGIQPLPIGSDDTPPMAVNDFNRVVKMDYERVMAESQNLPKPMLESDEEDEESEGHPDENLNVDTPGAKPVTPSDFQALIGMLDEKVLEGDIGNLVGSGDNQAIEKLQLMRLWQLMQEENLRRRQEAEIAMLNAQRVRMKLDRSGNRNSGLEKVTDLDAGESQDDLESGDLIDEEEDVYPDEDAPQQSPEKSNIQEEFDERPVEGEKKSFKQILEAELRKESEQKPVEEKPKGPIKRPFLRRGQGLARFKGPPVRKPPKQKSENSRKPPSKTENFIKPAPNTFNFKENMPGKNVVLKKPPVNSVRPKTQKSSNLPPQQKLMQKIRKPINKLQLKPDLPPQRYPQDVEMPSSLEDDSRRFRPAEDADLEEFEMLERYAEDDASFFNEPSLVVSVLQQDNKGNERDEKQLSLRDRVRERRRIREEARAKIHDSPKMNKLRLGNFGDSASKTSDGTDSDDVRIPDLGVEVENDEILSPQAPKPYFKSPEKQKIKVIQRKTASLVKKEKLVPVRPVAQSAAFSPVQHRNFPANSGYNGLLSSPNSAFSPHCPPVEGTKSSSQGSGEEIADVHNFQDDQTWGDIDVSIVNTSLPPVASDPVEDGGDSGRKYKCSDYMVPENEEVENPVRDTDAPDPISARGLSLSPPPPPTSLMQKLFPGLKMPKSSTTQIEEFSLPQEQDAPSSDDLPPDSDSQASVLKVKLQELEAEILKFKKENAALEILRQKQESDVKSFTKEVEEFRKQKDEELGRLEEYKKTEMKKLKKEKKLFEDHVLATKMMPRKEEREEIQKLQEELENLRVENKLKEQKWTSANNRMRNQVEKLTRDNQELQDRINEMEAQRIKDLNTQKALKPKQNSVWKTVNKIVENEFTEIENQSPDILPKSFPTKTVSVMNNPTVTGAKILKKQDKLTSKRPSNAVKMLDRSPDVLPSKVDLEKKMPTPQSPGETLHKDGKVEKVLRDGTRMVTFPNGTQKEISADGKVVKVRFANGDIKQIYGDGSIVYYYEENGTTHTTHPDGLQVFEFPNKQVEHHFCDGTKQITFPDQTVKYLHIDGTEQTVFPDGTEMHVATNKDKTIVFANGQREIHTESFKRREYPDGTSKTVFGDGRQETRYASGRLRVKDAHGNVIVDRITN